MLSKSPTWRFTLNAYAIFLPVRSRTLFCESSDEKCTSAQNDNLQVHEEKSRGVYVKNLSDYYVSSAREVYEIMRQGGAARVVTSTSKCLPVSWR
ncbi:uncharacterized protein F5891DRAFT_619414 [Suillus fuscotomentosus]|uniref:Kinesin motor domain-containing protein n=1 Tax=Suillus fuscotomentosus TaxID=1912939 RepID=A0AAD4EGG5_9AGAM|nr:uncharacterized protein F5891DRAFT_619414 [Suillus fuscotomentosus]KAG1905626.1 hypothetical protein F5891DRAFT_619414 [Suillus fuscotomentosus]